ncbi:MAG TPA: squalene/phytoene synthase family protein [Anaerolineales bacterium]|nr:squalene/phytoene synthase family protein [Anaerolineales bacterium]
MATPSETLARSITRSGNDHAYTTIRLLADRRLTADAFRAYAYFRWVDDRLDLGEFNRPAAQAFLTRQNQLIGAAYRGRRLPAQEPEENLLLDLLRRDRDPVGGLALYIRNLMEVMTFDTARRGRWISAEELSGYTRRLALGVTEALHYFIGGRPATPSPARHLAAAGAHVAHMLRDTREDVARGYFNIPREALQAADLTPEQFDHPSYLAWVRRRVEQARRCLRLGRLYLVQIDNLRFRVAGLAYCLRFEECLDVIESEGFRVPEPAISAPRRRRPLGVFAPALLAAIRRQGRSATLSTYSGRSARAKGSDPA